MSPTRKVMPALRRRLSSPTAFRLVASVAVVLLAGCGKEGGAPGAAPAPVAAHLVTVAPRSVPIQFDIVGQVEGSKQVEVRARVSGNPPQAVLSRRRSGA